MPLIDETPELLLVLATVPGVKAVHEGWPKNFEQLPCIAVEAAANEPVDFRDGKPYLYALEYYVRVFAVKADQRRDIAAAIEGTEKEPGPMPRLGYTLANSWGDSNPNIRQKIMLYKKTRGSD